MKRRRSLWKGIVAGAAGGLAATWVMGHAQGLAGRASEKLMPKDKFHELHRASADAQETTSKVAERVTRPLLGRRLRHSERAKPVVHLTKSPREYPVAMHGTELGSHVVYGMTLEAVRRLVRKILRG